MIDNVEILAPVGSMESLYAAVENGANAVYLGGKLFNARQYASNFSNEDLINAVEYAHLRNVKVYVTVNILLDDCELKELVDYLIFLYNIDIDAILVQDLGVLRILRKVLPDFEVHGSTQMSINNYMGAKFLEELGIKRVVLARELSIDDIRYIKKNSNIELETFIHGALCVSYSGQCLMSSLIGGRSGNRGRCAQPCRMPYSIVDMNNNKVISKNFEERYLLSPKDLNTIDYLSEIINSGIVSLKIEGRMKKPEYVATIVNKYRQELDRILGSHDNVLTERDYKDIAQMFNRGFTKGFMAGDFGEDIISFDKPNNRGIFIGEVIKVDKTFIHISLEDVLNKGDGIEIINQDGKSYGQIIDKILESSNSAGTSDKERIMKVNSIQGVTVGAKVYKTLDLMLNLKAGETYNKKDNMKKYVINMAIEIKVGEPVKLVLWNEDNHITVISDEVAEKGIKVSLDKEKVIKQMTKLGDTPYTVESIEVDLENGTMVPVSVLNGIRREAIDKLNKKRGNYNHRVEITPVKLKEKLNEVFNYPRNSKTKNKGISIKVDTASQFKQLDLKKMDRLYLNFKDDISDYIKEVKKHNKEVYIATEKIIQNEEFRHLEKVFDKLIDVIDGVSVSNIGTLKFIKDRYRTNIHCDIGLNVFNSSTVSMLLDSGVKSLTLSPELKVSQISNICENNNIKYEAIGYGYLPLMITKHCPMSLVKGCKNDKQCNTCELASGYGLYDRKGMTFEMQRKEKSTIIYNSQPLIVAEYMDKIFTAGIDLLRLDFTVEKENIKLVQELYYDYINNKIDYDTMKRIVEQLKEKAGNTTGHFFRGVL